MKEFNCEATHLHVVQVRSRQRNGVHAQTTWKSDDAYICNDVKIWEKFPIHAMIQEDEIVKCCPFEGKKEVDRMEAKDGCAKN